MGSYHSGATNFGYYCKVLIKHTCLFFKCFKKEILVAWRNEKAKNHKIVVTYFISNIFQYNFFSSSLLHTKLEAMVIVNPPLSSKSKYKSCYLLFCILITIDLAPSKRSIYYKLFFLQCWYKAPKKAELFAKFHDSH